MNQAQCKVISETLRKRVAVCSRMAKAADYNTNIDSYILEANILDSIADAFDDAANHAT